MISFTVAGLPQPAGSKRAFVRGKHASIVDANPKAKDWKAAVAEAAYSKCPYIGEGPVAATFHFLFPRPRSHYGTGKNAETLKANAPVCKTTKPDIDKLSRAVLDGLTGVAYRDDAQVVSKYVTKSYGEPARVEITLVHL